MLLPQNPDCVSPGSSSYSISTWIKSRKKPQKWVRKKRNINGNRRGGNKVCCSPRISTQACEIKADFWCKTLGEKSCWKSGMSACCVELRRRRVTELLSHAPRSIDRRSHWFLQRAGLPLAPRLCCSHTCAARRAELAAGTWYGCMSHIGHIENQIRLQRWLLSRAAKRSQTNFGGKWLHQSCSWQGWNHGASAKRVIIYYKIYYIPISVIEWLVPPLQILCVVNCLRLDFHFSLFFARYRYPWFVSDTRIGHQEL